MKTFDSNIRNSGPTPTPAPAPTPTPTHTHIPTPGVDIYEQINTIEKKITMNATHVIEGILDLFYRISESTLAVTYFPAYFMYKRIIDIFFLLPEINIIIEYLFNPSTKMMEKQDYMIHAKETRTVNATLKQFNELISSVSKIPFVEVMRTDPTIPIYETELMSITLIQGFVSIVLYYICVKVERIENELLRMTFVNYESELFMCTTTITLRFENDSIEITGEKIGYVHQHNYGPIPSLFFNVDYYQKGFEVTLKDNVNSLMLRI